MLLRLYLPGFISIAATLSTLPSQFYQHCCDSSTLPSQFHQHRLSRLPPLDELLFIVCCTTRVGNVHLWGGSTKTLKFNVPFQPTRTPAAVVTFIKNYRSTSLERQVFRSVVENALVRISSRIIVESQQHRGLCW